MKICPNCHKEFDDSNTLCPTCEQQLTAVSPDTGSIVEIVTPEVATTAAPQVEETESLSLLSFHGRIGRKAFNLRWIPMTLATFFLYYLLSKTTKTTLTTSLYMIIIPISISALTFKVRRLRDIGLSRWKIIALVILTLIPVLDLLIAGYMIFKKGKFEAAS